MKPAGFCRAFPDTQVGVAALRFGLAWQVDKGALKVDLLFSGSLEPLDEAIKETG